MSRKLNKLVVDIFRKMETGPGPEALKDARLAMRQSVRKVPDGTTMSLAHPFFWAPFVLVGEGK